MNGTRPSPPRWKSPWLWIGLSCAVLVLGAGGLIVGVNLWMFKSYREVRDRIREEPILMTAEVMARKDPNVTVVSRDEKNHAITLRNQQTGERFVLAQIEKNQLRIQTDAGEVVLQLSRLPSGQLLLGSAAGPLPSWIPAYPGAPTRHLYALSNEGVDSGSSVVTPSVPIQDVYRFYEDDLARRGFEVLPAGDSLSVSSPDLRSSVFLSPSPQSRPPGVLLTWSEMAGNRKAE